METLNKFQLSLFSLGNSSAALEQMVDLLGFRQMTLIQLGFDRGSNIEV